MTFTQIAAILFILSMNVGYTLGQTIVCSTHQSATPLHIESSAPLHISNYVPGMRHKQAGKTMLIVGGLLQMGGTILFTSPKPQIDGSQLHPDDGSIPDKQFLGAFMIAGGTAFAVSGVIIWIVGVRRYNRYNRNKI